jgi:hypothetical protein
MTIPLERKIIHLGWPVAASIIFAVFSAGVGFKTLIDKQELIYEAVTQHSIILDSVQKWHKEAVAHRQVYDPKVNQMSTKVDVLWDAYNYAGEALFTEKRVKGRIFFEKVKTTK